MKILDKQFRKVMLYFSASLVLAIALPVLLKNVWACTLGIAAMSLFGYQAYTYYQTAKKEDYIIVKARCVNISYNDLGAATYAKKCAFEPIDDQPITGKFELQIVNEGRNRKDSRRVANGNVYEFIFKSSALNANDKEDTTMFNNATLIAYETDEVSNSDIEYKNNNNKEK